MWRREASYHFILCPINAASWARSGQSEGLDLKAEGSKGKALCEGHYRRPNSLAKGRQGLSCRSELLSDSTGFNQEIFFYDANFFE